MPRLIQTLLAAAALGAVLSRPGHTQSPERVRLSRAQAVESALSRGARLALAGTDTAFALGLLRSARELANPTILASYSKSVPSYHLEAELPLGFPWLRASRVGAATAARSAAQYRFASERAAAALDADTTYTRALAAAARARLSGENARAADSLRLIAIARRDAGDASDLDVALATVNAGQQLNAAMADSIALAAMLTDLQTTIGLRGDAVVIVLADTLAPPPAGEPLAPGAGPPLAVAAAEAEVDAARQAAAFQRRSAFAAPSLTVGFETGDPGEPGVLPTVGLAFPLPLFNWNRGAVLQADAQHERARVSLELARRESQAEIARADRARRAAITAIDRDRGLLASASQVAAMSLTAYAEGAAPLAVVLEAQRNAREILGQYVDHVADATVSAAALTALTLTSRGTP